MFYFLDNKKIISIIAISGIILTKKLIDNPSICNKIKSKLLINQDKYSIINSQNNNNFQNNYLQKNYHLWYPFYLTNKNNYLVKNKE